MGILFKRIKKIAKIEKLPPYEFNVTAMNYFTDNILRLGVPLKGFNLSPGRMAHTNKIRHYEYFFKCEKTELVPEITNKHDTAAIMVLLDGVKIGYVPAVLTDDVRPYLNIPCEVTSRLTGGRYRYLINGVIEEDITPFSCAIKITPL